MRKVGGTITWTTFSMPFILAILPLILVAAQPLPAPPGPDGLPATDPKHPWKLFSGAPRVDTLSFALPEIIPVARRQFVSDQWQIFAVNEGRGRIVTMWKRMHHPLLLLFMGKVSARCTVTMQPLDRNRTRMVFQADMASHRDLHGNPMLGAAKRAYAKAALNYVTEVRAYLDAHRNLTSLAP
jgi:hypothetical protein